MEDDQSNINNSHNSVPNHDSQSSSEQSDSSSYTDEGGVPIIGQIGIQSNPFQRNCISYYDDNYPNEIKPTIWGIKPSFATCNHCSYTGDTITKARYGVGTFLTSACMLFMGCCLIPFICPSCWDYEHRCSKCKKRVGYRTFM